MTYSNLILVAITLMTCFNCKEKEGPTGLKSLIKLTEESKGVNCVSGGQKVDTGVDVNKNDVLDANEVQSTVYLCNGINGQTSLITHVVEPSGSNCASGGIKVSSGMDSNFNMSLDSDEIERTEYVCNGRDGELDLQIRLKITEYASSLVGGGGQVWSEHLFQFNKDYYPNIDSAFLVVSNVATYDNSGNVSGHGRIELFDITNDTPVTNSAILSDDIPENAYLKSGNIIDYLPSGVIDLGVKVSSEGSFTSQCRSIHLVIYRRQS